MLTKPTEIPPGSLTIYEVTFDELGNEVYVGPPKIYTNPITGAALDTPIKPTFNTPPVPRTSTPADTSTPGGRSINIEVKEGLMIRDGEPESKEVVPATITGWVNSENVLVSDDNNAYIDATVGVYCDALELSGFDLSGIPLNAEITGIKVTVERSQV